MFDTSEDSMVSDAKHFAGGVKLDHVDKTNQSGEYSPTLVVQCMWCGRIKDQLGSWDGKQGPLLPTASHGLCPRCAWLYYGYKSRGGYSNDPADACQLPSHPKPIPR